jgi:CheY-like chemotaxis protein
MARVFSADHARVLIAEPTGSGRQLLSDTVRSVGFKDVTVVASGEDVVGTLEQEPIDLVVMPFLAKQAVNGFHILNLVARQPSLRHTRVSLLYESDEEAWLEYAFALGAMSSHRKTMTRDHLVGEFQGLMATLKATAWRPVLTAAEYLRANLMRLGRLRSRLSLEESLCELFPGAPSLLLRLGEARVLEGDVAGGLTSIHQAGIIDERAKTLGQEIVARLGVAADAGAAKQRQVNALAVQRCVVIDPDSAVLALVSSLLRSVGVPQVDVFETGTAAWQHLQANPEPCLIIKEWRIPGIAAPLLLQQLRQHGHVNVPIVVISSVIRPAEVPLLREFGVDNVIPKPFSQQLFFKYLVWTIQQSRTPTEQKSLERKMRRLLAVGNYGDAERLYTTYMADARIQVAAKKQVEAEFCLALGRYREARDAAIDALKLSGDSLLLLNVVGKALLKMGDHKAALKFFEKANKLSPLNVEHLCHMAVASFETGAHDAATANVQQALAIDASNRMVNELECQHAILGGDSQRARALLTKLQSLHRVVSYMNNRAVALTRAGRYDEGLSLYKRTLESLPETWGDTHDTVAYNLGLAFARFGELDQAVEALKPVVARVGAPLHKRSASLVRRLDAAKAQGKEVALFSEPGATVDAAARGLADVDAGADSGSGAGSGVGLGDVSDAAVEPGELCLRGLLRAFEPTPELKALTEKEPRFRVRSVAAPVAGRSAPLPDAKLTH